MNGERRERRSSRERRRSRSRERRRSRSRDKNRSRRDRDRDRRHRRRSRSRDRYISSFCDFSLHLSAAIVDHRTVHHATIRAERSANAHIVVAARSVKKKQKRRKKKCYRKWKKCQSRNRKKRKRNANNRQLLKYSPKRKAERTTETLRWHISDTQESVTLFSL